MKNIYIAVDIETTGLSKKVDKMIELGAVAFYDNGEVTGRFQRFVQADTLVPHSIEKLTGITEVTLKKYGEPLHKVLCEFVEWIKQFELEGKVSMVAHNSIFDFGFIERDCKEEGIDFEYKIYDTLKIARRLIPTLSKHDLGTLCKVFGIENKSHHRADNDAEVLAQLFVILLKSMKIKKISLEEF